MPACAGMTYLFYWRNKYSFPRLRRYPTTIIPAYFSPGSSDSRHWMPACAGMTYLFYGRNKYSFPRLRGYPTTVIPACFWPGSSVLSHWMSVLLRVSCRYELHPVIRPSGFSYKLRPVICPSGQPSAVLIRSSRISRAFKIAPCDFVAGMTCIRRSHFLCLMEHSFC